MDERQEHGFHFTKEETQMEIVKSTVCVSVCVCVHVCLRVHIHTRVHMLYVINTQKTADKKQKCDTIHSHLCLSTTRKKNKKQM